MAPYFVSKSRYFFVFLSIIAAFGCISARLFYLQVINSKQLQAIAEKNRYKFQPLQARRGNIQDAKGNILATTRAVITLGVDPQLVTAQDEPKWEQLSKITGLPLQAIKSAVAQKYRQSADGSTTRLIRWKKLCDAIDDSTYEAILGLKIKGIYGNRRFERIYPAGKQGGQILGFVNKEEQAVGGIEQFMDFYLRGQNGWIESECDGKRKELSQHRSRMVEAKNGYNVKLFLDLGVQHILENMLEKIAQEYKPLSINLIVGEAQTGQILGIANYPNFDPNSFWEYPLEKHRNRAITDGYEPGSTFKIVVSSAVLEHNLVRLEDKFDCGIDSIMYQGRKVSLPKNHRKMGVMSVSELIQSSSNRGLAQLAMLLGDEKTYHYAKKFGFGEPTGYDSLGEIRGTLHSPKYWDGLTISRLPIGHAVLATALQTHCAMGVIANGGLLMKPLIVNEVTQESGEVVLQYKPQIRRRVISSHTAQTVKKLLYGVASNKKIQGIPIGYKTGTTQKIIDGKYSHTKHISSGSGFLDAKNHKIVITVVIDSPYYKGTAYGALVAAPCLRDIAEQLTNYLHLKPE